jgi:hypothetical protein
MATLHKGDNDDDDYDGDININNNNKPNCRELQPLNDDY